MPSSRMQRSHDLLSGTHRKPKSLMERQLAVSHKCKTWRPYLEVRALVLSQIIERDVLAGEHS